MPQRHNRTITETSCRELLNKDKRLQAQFSVKTNFPHHVELSHLNEAMCPHTSKLMACFLTRVFNARDLETFRHTTDSVITPLKTEM